MLWNLYFRAQYRLIRLLDPAIRAAWRRRRGGLDSVVDLLIAGRSSGRDRRSLVTLLRVDGAWYVGHPNGPAQWTLNLQSAGMCQVVPAGVGEEAPPRAFRAARLYGGPEREAVIRATWSQQPFPANLVYSLARRHVRSVGVYFRLTPIDGGA